MTAIAQTTMIGACLAILVYIAAITTGNYLATQNMPDNPLSQELQIDDALHKQISTSLERHKQHCSTVWILIQMNSFCYTIQHHTQAKAT